MLRPVACLLLAFCCSPALAFEFPDRAQPAPTLFETDGALKNDIEPDEDKDGPREIDGWFGRGFGVSVTFTGSLVLPGAGIGIDLAMPVHEVVSIVGGAHLIGNIFYEGSVYDLGARMYLDLGRKFSFYAETGFRLAYGRSLDYVGGTPEDPPESAGIGGFMNLGLEVGSETVRFHTDITLNGTDTLKVRYEVAFFMGVRFGVRFYLG